MGTRNLFRYVRLYSGADPVLDEEDQFRVTIPLDANHDPERGGSSQTTSPMTRERTGETTRERTGERTGETVASPVDGTSKKILDVLRSAPKTTTRELAARLGITAKGIEWQIKRLKAAGLLVREGGRACGVWRVAPHDQSREND